MKITKRHLRRIIREEKSRVLAETGMSAGAGDPDVYDDAFEQAGQIIEDVINNYGPDGYTVDALVKALRDAANMAENDERLRG